jgi:hypothetical protein
LGAASGSLNVSFTAPCQVRPITGSGTATYAPVKYI